MKINSDDILKQNFSVKALGFNKEEVRAFLELVAAEYEELNNENLLLKKQLTENGDQTQLIDKTRGEVKEILSTLQQFSKESLEIAHKNNLLEQQLMKKDEEIIKSINNEVGAEIRELLETIQGFKKITETRGKEIEFATKDDLKRFLSTAQRIKEEEVEEAEGKAALIITEAEQKAETMVGEAEGEADRIKEEAALIINEAQQKAEAIVREAQGKENRIKEEAALIITEAQQEAEAMVREAQSEEDRIKEEAALIMNQAQQKAETMIKEAENEGEKIKENRRAKAALIINEAQQKAEAMVREAESEAEKKKEEAALVIRRAQQKAEAIVNEAQAEEEKIKTALVDLKKQYRFFEQRIKQVIEFQLKLLDSVNEEGTGEEIGKS